MWAIRAIAPFSLNIYVAWENQPTQCTDSCSFNNKIKQNTNKLNITTKTW